MTNEPFIQDPCNKQPVVQVCALATALPTQYFTYAVLTFILQLQLGIYVTQLTDSDTVLVRKC